MFSIRLTALIVLAVPLVSCEVRENRPDTVETGMTERAETAPSPSAPPEVGDAAPEFALPDSAGRTVRLADARGKKVVLAFYRAHW